MNKTAIDRLAWTVSQSQHVVVMSGAGLSVSSGIPTFRDRMKALWSQFDPMEVASLSGFKASPDKVWHWHQQMRDVVASATPNPAHSAVADLASLLTAECTVITQNIDGLHSKAGSSNVIELHGNISRLRCHAQCGHSCDWNGSISKIPLCPKCGAYLRPDVVWFEESLSIHDVQRAQESAQACDVFIIAGTTALVHPAASLPQFAKSNGALLVEINPEETNFSGEADIAVRDLAEKVLPELIEQVRKRIS